MRKNGPLSYEEILHKYPEWVFLEAAIHHKEETDEATERARIRSLRRTGYVVQFLQEHKLTRKVICSAAPNIPDDLQVYLRDVTPEALELYRTGYQKWCRRFERDMNADPGDVRILEKELAKIRAPKIAE